MAILDSDLLIGLLRNDQAAKKMLKQLVDAQTHLCTTTISSFELLRGVFLSKQKRANLQNVASLLSALKIYSFTLYASFICAEKIVETQKSEKEVPLADLMIGSIAIAEKETVVTRNEKDFMAISGLTVTRW